MTQIRSFMYSLAMLSLTAPSTGARADSTALPAADAKSPVPVPVLSWRPCGTAFPGKDCAVASVPLDYADPRGATTQIALARVPAADQAHKIGTVFINPGGPGSSAVNKVLSSFGTALAAELDQRFDVVGFDPRGVGASDPLRCFDTADEQLAFFTQVAEFPFQPEQLGPFFDSFRALAPICFGRHQSIIGHMSTANVARDMDLLRQAVGDQRLNYLGFSYGSYLGNTYANLFPDRVRALVIDGVLDPRLWSSGLQILSDRTNTAKELAEFLRLCDAAGDACALAAGAGAKGRYDATAAALRIAPVTLGGAPFTYSDFITATVGAMARPESWGGSSGFAAFVASLDELVHNGAGASQRAAGIAAAVRQASARSDAYDNSFDAYYGNQCSDTEYPHTFPVFRDFDAFAAAGSIFGQFWWTPDAGCAEWPVAKDRFSGPWGTRTSAPVLVVGNFYDGITSYDGAVASSQLLRGSRLLSYAGWGHTAFGRSECVTNYVVQYLLSGSLPATGTVCPANPNPFLPQTAAPRTATLMPSPDVPGVAATFAAPPPFQFFRTRQADGNLQPLDRERRSLPRTVVPRLDD